MRRGGLTLLAALGVVAGLAVTASSTSHVAYVAGMRSLALAAIVVVLEVVNTLGTLVWLTDPRPHAKWQAGVLVGCASVVTGWCGLITYDLVGLVGPFFVLAGVHLANLAATTPAAQPPAQQVRVIARVPLPPPTGAVAPAKPSAPAETDALAGPELEPGAADPPADESTEPTAAGDQRVVDLARRLARGEDLTGPAIATEHGLSDRTGRRLLADARAHLEQLQPLHLVTDRTETTA